MWLTETWANLSVRNPWVIFASVDTLVARTVEIIEQKEKEKVPVKPYDQTTQSYKTIHQYSRVNKHKSEAKNKMSPRRDEALCPQGLRCTDANILVYDFYTLFAFGKIFCFRNYSKSEVLFDSHLLLSPLH